MRQKRGKKLRSLHGGSSRRRRAQPATVACKTEAQSEYVHVAYTIFCVFDADFACSVGAYQQKFLHRSSAGSLLRVRCWLGGREKAPPFHVCKESQEVLLVQQVFAFPECFFFSLFLSFCQARVARGQFDRKKVANIGLKVWKNAIIKIFLKMIFLLGLVLPPKELEYQKLSLQKLNV